MIEEDIHKRLQMLEQKIDAIYASVEKVRKYILATLIVAVVVFVLPFLLIPLVLPSFFSYYSQMSSLGL